MNNVAENYAISSLEILVSVIIPTYKDWSRLAICLDALYHQTYPSNLTEIIIINNDPLSDCPFEVKENVKVLKEPCPGSYAARNLGILASNGEIIAFTDSDCIPSENWIETCVRCLINNPKFKRISGKIQIFPLRNNPNYINEYEELFAFNQKGYAKKGLAATANMIVYKEVFNKVGLFNSLLFSGGDHEWCQRAEKFGFPIFYCENSIVLHPARNKSQILTKVRRLYPNYMNIHFNTKFQAWFFGVFLLRPPINVIPILCAKIKNGKLSFINGIRIFLLIYRKRIEQIREHYSLIFGGEKERM